ncbi:MAG: ABC transporter ATP-binding protein [Candidatus Edwardsbacteria bacterium]|jgi:branched-chain amino acid transport system ATP-binding protein|nr:ABC transporter ATP-binding protein [Candidatus Edwardsbacteria bacterium]
MLSRAAPAAGPAALLSLRGLRCGYGQLEVLHGISLEVRRGEIVALLGANGAGKTTAIAAISGLLPATAGAISYGGRDITGLPPDRIVALGVVQVPEGRRIFPGLTVRENLEMGAYLTENRRARAAGIERAFAMFPRLAERRDQPGGTLSGGEQQMLAIARGLMSQPALMLLDEPSLGLAPIVVDAVFDLIREIRAGGITVVLVEQNAQRSLEIADRGYLLETGAMVLEGTGAALLAHQRVRASYLGA